MSNSRSASVNGNLRGIAHRETGGAPLEHVVGITPAVMLSPKARNFVALSLGGPGVGPVGLSPHEIAAKASSAAAVACRYRRLADVI
jgi:hypothetical protein